MAVPLNPDDEGARQAKLLWVLMTNLATWVIGVLIIVCLAVVAYWALVRRVSENPS